MNVFPDMVADLVEYVCIQLCQAEGKPVSSKRYVTLVYSHLTGVILYFRITNYIVQNAKDEELRCNRMNIGFYLVILCNPETVENLIKAMSKSVSLDRRENEKIFKLFDRMVPRMESTKQRYFKLKMVEDAEYGDWWIRKGA